MSDSRVPAADPSRRLLTVLTLLFFASGATGLIYQVLWLRQLSFVFGVTIEAASTVLASFMGGLALGSFLGGRFVADRVHRPLAAYGIAEIAVGFTAVLTPLALRGVESIYAAVGPMAPLRFALSFIVLLIPTTLMGATLPIVIRSSLLSRRGLGEKVALLYGTNTAGAIAGTLVTGFVLIGALGLSMSFKVAAGINVVIGLVAIVAGRQAIVATPADPTAGPTLRDGSDEGAAGLVAARSFTRRFTRRVTRRQRRTVLAVFGVSGFVTLALEVVWFRMLVLYFPSTTYSFTLMLATVLGGIALGSYVVTPLLRRDVDWFRLLGMTEIALGVISVVSIAAAGRAFSLVDLAGAAPGSVLVLPIACALLIAPAALVMGAAFPVGVRLYADVGRGPGDGNSGETGERVGTFYAVNLCGGIVGSLASGFVLLPLLGSKTAAITLSSLSVLGGVVVIAQAEARRRLAVPAAAIAGFVALALVVPDPVGAALTGRFPGDSIIWREEGAQTTVSVHARTDGSRAMYLDGLHQANDTPDMVALHRTIGTTAMAIARDPKEALVIGLGGGATSGAVSRFNGTRVEVVELSDSVVRGASYFSHINDDVTSRSNVKVTIDDGRNHLLLTDRRYDVITADIIQPVHAGAGLLYSAEYFRLVRAALAEDGVALQWVGQRAATQYGLIVRTFLSVFPDATFWAGGTLMVGTKGPLRIERAEFERKLADPSARSALAAMGYTSFDALLGQYSASAPEMRDLVGDGPILTDDRPRIEYFRSLPANEPDIDLSRLRGDPSHVTAR